MPIKQKIRPLLLLKKQFAHFQRVGGNTYALANRLAAGTSFRAISIGASVGGSDVTVNFSEDVAVTDLASGITIRVNNNIATFTAVKGSKSVTYTLTSQNPLDYNDDVTWQYSEASAGADPYTGADSGQTLSDTTLRRIMPAPPPAPQVQSVVATDQSTIVVTFDMPVTGSSSLGITWGGLVSTPTAPNPSSSNTITYTLQPPDAGNIYNNSTITWTYDDTTGTLVNDSAIPLASVGPITTNVSGLPNEPAQPVAPIAGWTGNENCAA